jgi:hypothetical protein
MDTGCNLRAAAVTATVPLAVRAAAALAVLGLAVMTASAGAQDELSHPGTPRGVGPLLTVDGLFHQSSSTTSLEPPKPAFCHNSYECHVLFPKIDRGYRVVTHMSCTVTATTPTVFKATLVPLRPDGQWTFRQHYAALSRVLTGVNRFVLNTPTLALFAPGERPSIVIHTQQAAQVSGLCTISGRVVSAP